MTKPVVSKRNHFHSCAELVEDGMIGIPDDLKHPDLARWLLRYTERVVKKVARHFGLGAQNGIEQTANLLCDPDFYERRRETRRKLLKQFREEEARQEWERKQFESCPTAEQIEQHLKWYDERLVYHHSEIKRITEKIEALHSKTPMNIERRASQTTQ
jgi:hypothetical protein